MVHVALGVGFGRRPFSLTTRSASVLRTLMGEFEVFERDGEIIVTGGGFCAVYFKPDEADPQIKLKRRTVTNDHALLSRSWKAAVAKARELGWIV